MLLDRCHRCSRVPQRHGYDRVREKLPNGQGDDQRQGGTAACSEILSLPPTRSACIMGVFSSRRDSFLSSTHGFSSNLSVQGQGLGQSPGRWKHKLPSFKIEVQISSTCGCVALAAAPSARNKCTSLSTSKKCWAGKRRSWSAPLHHHTCAAGQPFELSDHFLSFAQVKLAKNRQRLRSNAIAKRNTRASPCAFLRAS